ncbi:MAG: 50S ribosome-binding GTPase [Deltaproteobacteria bacterium]|nr:50S ribosome-binding GTPase [Deltaproteobacteria bacterium]
MDNLNYPYLLAVHALCVDGQLHQNELRFLQSLAQNVGVDTATEAAAELILVQADVHLSLETVLQHILPDQRTHALSLAILAAQFDEVLDRTEQRLLDQLRRQWKLSDDLFAQMQDLARKKTQRLIADLKTTSRGEVSTGAKVLSGLEAILGKTVVDRVVSTLGTDSMKERIQDYRIEALLSGPEYDKAIKECRDVGLRDIEVADACLQATAKSLQEIGIELEGKIAEINAKIGDKPAQAAREALRSMKDDRTEIERVINHELQEFQELQIKKRRAMNFYTIAFMGRSKAGKSTLHAVVTGEGWDQIGVGRQNTTRLNRVYEWHNIRIIDTPGIATPGGEELEKVAESIIDEADLICFVVTNNNQQTSEFEFLKLLRNKGKPLLVLLNVKEDLSHPVRLKRFLDKPDQAFSDDKDRLGGHKDRIRRDAAEHYGNSNFPIIPVHLLAAQIAQQQPDHEHAEVLMKASRLQHFLDSVRLSLLDEGLLRRSQNLLGSTVADIERPCRDVKARSEFYLDFSRQIRDRAKDSARRLKKAQEDHACQLEQDLRGIFAALQREVPDFAEDHWDDSESYLNDAWSDEIRRFGMEKKINCAQDKSIEAFSSDMADLLEEVGRELALNRRLAVNTEGLSEQDSSTLMAQTFKWSSSIAGVVFSVALMNSWNPGGWILAGVGVAIAVVGLLGSIFESKASKRRKAVAKISSALESQIEKQEKKVVEAALKHFREQCLAGAAAAQDYFQLSADGLDFVGQALGRGAETLQKQSSILNTHFAARILDFAGNSPSESSAQVLRAQIQKVRRKVGESIEIEVSPKMRVPKDLNNIESVIQEKITLQKAGA